MTEKLGSERAIETLREQQKVNVEKCKQEIEAILEKYWCDLGAVPFIDNDGRVRARTVLSMRQT